MLGCRPLLSGLCLMARLPGRKKDGCLARHIARLRRREGVGGSPGLEASLPQTVGGQRVQAGGHRWRPGLGCAWSPRGPSHSCLLCSLTVEASLLRASGFQAGPATRARPQDAEEEGRDPGCDCQHPWVPGPVLRGLPEWQ